MQVVDMGERSMCGGQGTTFLAGRERHFSHLVSPFDVGLLLVGSNGRIERWFITMRRERAV